MSESVERVKGAWWGWGAGEEVPALSSQAEEMLSERFGGNLSPPAPAVQPSEVELPETRPMPRGLPGEIKGLLDDREPERLRHSVGMSYPDLVRLRSGRIEHAPDAVAHPRNADQVAALLAECSRKGVAVVPFGGGTSVVGGVDPDRGGHDAVISVDLAGLDALAIDRRSGLARMGPGLRGPQVEEFLGRNGLTLGHFPQSFMRASVGGFAATRSAGQASSGYGRFDDLVASIELTTPIGSLRTLETPHTAAGPALREVAIGSEGTLGIITEVTCRVRQAPDRRVYEGWIAEDFTAGCEAVREMAQGGEIPDVIRVSDEQETDLGFAMSSASPRIKSILAGYLQIRGKGGGSLMICGWEGTRDVVSRRRRSSRRRLKRAGAMALGRNPGRSWERSRFDGPYLRDHLIDRGILVETLETAHTWAELGNLYQTVRESLRVNLGPGAIVMCHLSHAYRDGASLYFTFLAPVRPGDEIETWSRVKTAACDSIVAAGGTITHHHAVGRDHSAWMYPEVGEVGLEALIGIKRRLDPEGIMNPGVLIPKPR